jgi:hypothetical protein
MCLIHPIHIAPESASARITAQLSRENTGAALPALRLLPVSPLMRLPPCPHPPQNPSVKIKSPLNSLAVGGLKSGLGLENC